MQRIAPVPTPAPSPDRFSASAGGATAPSSVGRTALAPLRGDRIDAPVAAASPDPNGVCPIADPAGAIRETNAAVLTLAGAAALAIAPEVAAAAGLGELAGAAADAASAAGSTLGRGLSNAGASVLSYASRSGTSIVQTLGRQLAASAERFKTPEAFGEMVGTKLHQIAATLPESAAQGAVIGGAAAAAASGVERLLGTGREPASAPAPTSSPSLPAERVTYGDDGR